MVLHVHVRPCTVHAMRVIVRRLQVRCQGLNPKPPVAKCWFLKVFLLIYME